MSEQVQSLRAETRRQYKQTDALSADTQDQGLCPICGGIVEAKEIGFKLGWICLVGGYAHYYQARYGHLKRWFTSGQGNLREPVIQAMNCAP